MEEMQNSAPKRTLSRFRKPSEPVNEVAFDAPPRAPERPEMVTDDPRARAAKRAAELRGHLGSLDEGTDDFYIPAHYVPDGWSYEWKRKLTMGQEDPAYQVSIARKGWEPVPASRHPSMMPDGNKYQIIERKGMILMERPLEITEEAQRAERRRAQLQVRQKEEQLNAAPQGQFERNNKDAPLARVKKGYSPIAIPDA
jgi:hypothetical protein